MIRMPKMAWFNEKTVMASAPAGGNARGSCR